MRRLIRAALVAVLMLGIPGMAWGKHRHGRGCGHREYYYDPYSRWERKQYKQYQKELERERRYFYRQYYYPQYYYPRYYYPRSRGGVNFYWGW